MSVVVFSFSIENKSNRESDERESSSDKTLSISRAGNTDDKGCGEEQHFEETKLAKKVKISYKANVKSYPIDEMKCSTTKNGLDRLREVYNIPDDVDLRIPDPKYTHSRPPRGCVTLYLKCLKLGVRLSL